MRRKRKIIYIVNPISGTSSKDAIQNIIATETLREGISFQFMPSVANGDYSFLHPMIVEEKITDIVIVGGDGTISPVIESLKKLPVQFGIIPAGSGNGLAFGAGITKTPKKALQTVFNNNAVLTDGFRINGRFACMLCGLGFDAKVAHDFADQSRRGLITYVQQVFKNFFNAKPYSFKITLPKITFETEAYFISIANSNQFGNHFTIAPKASLCDGLLDIVIVTEQSKLAMLYNTMLQVGGQKSLLHQKEIDNKRGIIYFQTEEITISNRSMAPMHIDGDPVASERKVNIVIENRCFKLLTNKEKI
ncbi:MAG: diacylglycerol/lipid kinase family protein [Niabella sp.]